MSRSCIVSTCALLLICLGGFLIVQQVSSTFRWMKIQGWDKTPAVIEEVQLGGHGGRYPTYFLVATYTYQYNNKTYQSSQVKADNMNRTAWARDAYAELSRNPNTHCYVNPTDPEQAVLARTYPLFVVLLSIVFGASLLYISFLALKSLHDVPDRILKA